MMRTALILGLLAIIIFGPVGYAYVRKNDLRNFRTVEHGLVYRSGELSSHGLEKLIREYGIKMVVNFRAEEANPDKVQAEADLCAKLGVKYEKIICRKWHAEVEGGPIPADQAVRDYFNVMDRRIQEGPILVHCLAGKHRTGAFVALYRMKYNDWSNVHAIEEMQECGYEDIYVEMDVLSYLQNFDAKRFK